MKEKFRLKEKKRNSASGTSNTASQHSVKANLFSNENEEDEIAETRVSGNVDGKRIILIDDVIDTGRQLKRAVEALRTAGASCIYVLATHGVFSAEALAIINSLEPNFVKSVHVTNSIPQTISKTILKERLGIIDVSGAFIIARVYQLLVENSNQLILDQTG